MRYSPWGRKELDATAAAAATAKSLQSRSAVHGVAKSRT